MAIVASETPASRALRDNMRHQAAEQNMRRAQGRRLRLGAAIALAGVLVAGPVLAQGWWPWSNSEEERRPPIPQEPVFRPDEPQNSQPPPPDSRSLLRPRRTGRPRTPSACSS